MSYDGHPRLGGELAISPVHEALDLAVSETMDNEASGIRYFELISGEPTFTFVQLHCNEMTLGLASH